VRVLVVGRGGREHALAWRLAQDPEVEGVVTAPGNPGTARVGENEPGAGEEDARALIDAVRRRGIDLVVIGPEAPLVAGVADRLREAGAAVLGPGAAAARLEGSKAFAKELMAGAGVPTAPFAVCESAAAAHRAVDRMGAPIVVKADGLAAGKGVTVAMDAAAAHAAVEEAMVQRRFGAAGERLVLERFVPGPEASAFALCDGEAFELWPSARDHKRLETGDRGPNTGGMGAVTPAPVPDREAWRRVAEEVIAPTLRALGRAGAPFVGILYAGLKWTLEGPVVLEFNVRLGDPEAQALVMTMRGGVARAFEAAARGRLQPGRLAFAGAGAAVVAAAPGYPAAPRTGGRIEGLDAVEERPVPDTALFLAGVGRQGDAWVVEGGRVLAAAAWAERPAEAAARAYARLSAVRFEGMQVRADIGRA
jgi:phosphoribosylamine--glycine ligase